MTGSVDYQSYCLHLL